jgi:small subunit ribosomal protein S1
MSRRNEEAIARFIDTHQVGDELVGTVDSIVAFGAFIAVADGVHGLLHESEYRERPTLGDSMRVRIAAIDADAGRMSLLPV